MWGHRVGWLPRHSECPPKCTGPRCIWWWTYTSLSECFGSCSDPNINRHLHYPNDIDRSLNETVPDKIRKYPVDYNNNPPTVISFMSTIASTSGRLPWHGEFVCLFFNKFVGKLTVFFQLQDFSLCILPVTSSTTVARCSLPSLYRR